MNGDAGQKKFAIVTGASRGIGEAVAKGLAASGYAVALVARNKTRLRQVLDDIRAAGGDGAVHACDLRDRHAIDRLFVALAQRWPRIDVLVNCAGVGGLGRFEESSASDISDPLKVPLAAAMHMARNAARNMLTQTVDASGHRGQIVNIVGPTAYFHLPYMAAYTTARAGLVAFTRSLDEELCARLVRAKSVCPAWVDTDYLSTNQSDPDWMPRIAKLFPRHTAGDIAGQVIQAIESSKPSQSASRLINVFASCYRHFPRVSVWMLKGLGLFQAPNATRTANVVGAGHWTNWEESIDLKAGKVVSVRNVEEIRDVVLNKWRYPSPVRAAGSRHTTTHCGVADGGTLMIMRAMKAVKHIDRDAMTVTVEAGALYRDVAKALECAGLQFYVNVEIGNLTMGSAACTGTKDASFPGEFGQVCSYCCAVKLVKANGEVCIVDESDGDLLQAVRSSYGLLGVIYEVTFKVRPAQAMEIYHRNYTLKDFERALPSLRQSGCSIMYYLFPFQDRVTVEMRRYLEVAHQRRRNRSVWWLRNLAWKILAPALGNVMTNYVRHDRWRYVIVDGFGRCLQLFAWLFLRSRNTSAADQIIAYPEHKNFAKYTFSIWAFPEANIMPIMRGYFDFCKQYYRRYGFRCDLLNVGYRIEQDSNPLFSYSYDSAVMTLDPVTTGAPGWDEFLNAYNEFCSQNGGVPLFNQTKWLTRAQVQRAFGERIGRFWQLKSAWDPEDRLLNQYFAELFAPAKTYSLFAGRDGSVTHRRRTVEATTTVSELT